LSSCLTMERGRERNLPQTLSGDEGTGDQSGESILSLFRHIAHYLNPVAFNRAQGSYVVPDAFMHGIPSLRALIPVAVLALPSAGPD